MIHTIQHFIGTLHLAPLTVVGLMALTGLAFGKASNKVRLPSIIGYLVVGVLLGPSLVSILSEESTRNLSFLTDVALGFVALSIGLELKMRSLKSIGGGIVVLIFAESIFAGVLVTIAVYLVCGDLPLSILFGALAPASAPAGTVAIIHEYRAKGTLTKALYAIVGFDDGLAIIIYGFAAAIARAMISGNTDGGNLSAGAMLLAPLRDIGLSTAIGIGIAAIYGFALRFLQHKRDVFILTFGTILLAIGICKALDVSLIFTNLVVGIVVINVAPERITRRIADSLTDVMPLLFVLFFVLAGANLHLASLPALGLIGAAYIVARSVGKISGAWIGAVIGRTESKIRNLSGLGILSQAGVAIGLALLVQTEFGKLGEWGAHAGSVVVTTITATSIVFEIVGPLFAKFALKRAGEIPTTHGVANKS